MDKNYSVLDEFALLDEAIKTFGGIAPLSKEIGVIPQTIYKWKKNKVSNIFIVWFKSYKATQLDRELINTLIDENMRLKREKALKMVTMNKEDLIEVLRENFDLEK